MTARVQAISLNNEHQLICVSICQEIRNSQACQTLSIWLGKSPDEPEKEPQLTKAFQAVCQLVNQALQSEYRQIYKKYSILPDGNVRA